MRANLKVIGYTYPMSRSPVTGFEVAMIVCLSILSLNVTIL